MSDENIFWNKLIAWTSVIAAVIGIFGLVCVLYQLYQSNKLKRFENYNYFNNVYDDWYANIPDELKDCNGKITTKWKDLTPKGEAWVRRYFDLYAQEYYFHDNDMIPKEMWDSIHSPNNCKGAAIVNFREYPVLLEGYQIWKKRGAFEHPKNFTKMLDEKIRKCPKEIKAPPIDCER